MGACRGGLLGALSHGVRMVLCELENDDRDYVEADDAAVAGVRAAVGGGGGGGGGGSRAGVGASRADNSTRMQ